VVKQLKDFWNDEEGVGIVEIILILVILIMLIVIFRTKITKIVTDAFKNINDQGKEINKAIDI